MPHQSGGEQGIEPVARRAPILAAAVSTALLADFLIVGVENWRGAVGAHGWGEVHFTCQTQINR